MITYENNLKDSSGSIFVLLEGRKVGKIQHDTDGYRYYPSGARTSDAQAFPNLAGCKASLENDD